MKNINKNDKKTSDVTSYLQKKQENDPTEYPFNIHDYWPRELEVSETLSRSKKSYQTFSVLLDKDEVVSKQAIKDGLFLISQYRPMPTHPLENGINFLKKHNAAGKHYIIYNEASHLNWKTAQVTLDKNCKVTELNIFDPYGKKVKKEI